MSLETVYDMTLAEFQMRRIGFNQADIRSWQKFRKVAYEARVAMFRQGPQPSTESQYMYLPGDQIRRASDKQIELYSSLMVEYLEKKAAKG